MRVIFTNSHVFVHKLCSRCVRSMFLRSSSVQHREGAEGEKDKNTVHNDVTSSNLKGKTHAKNNRVTLVTTGYKTRSRHRKKQAYTEPRKASLVQSAIHPTCG